MSNPNPQGNNARFRGVGSMGYKKYYDLADKAEGAIDLARFGKKVDYSYKVSNNELMEEHLK